jgi:RNA polymerase sigma-70 factor (ECF subfamily)
MGELSDIGDLVRRAQHGDVRAFERLVDGHIPQLRRFARAFARSDQDADDLTQEALIKVYRSIGGYRFQSALSTWLFAVTRNAFVDMARSRAGRERTLAAAEPTDDVFPSPDEVLARAEEHRRLWRAIRDIPPEFRTALVLVDIEGLSYDEVAAIEKVALGTVKSRVSRAREQLRQRLGDRRTPAAGPGNRATPTFVSPEEGADST